MIHLPVVTSRLKWLAKQNGKLYKYICQKCKHIWESVKSPNSDLPHQCPTCLKREVRQIKNYKSVKNYKL